MSGLYAWGAVVAAAVVAIAAIWAAAYYQGRNRERLRVQKVLTDAEREMHDAVESARRNPVRLDRERLRGAGDRPAAADEDPGRPPGGR